MATKKTLTEIMQTVQDHLGEKVILRTNKGRKKVKIKEGILLETYPAVFIVRIDLGLESERKISYSYSDILTETVEVTLTENDQRIYIS
ncbi:MAG: Veg family protein [Clostridiales bacterium]|nr:Veg family protein [Clostridiales bacterium]